MSITALPPVRVEDLSLEYRIPRHSAGSLKETMIRIARRGIAYDLLTAVNDVTFDVRPGEVFGIIGPNGAGKSTLMKVIARVLPPTNGRVRVRGRVSPMIELGAGFNPEQTARENVVLYGTLLGRDVRHMKARCAAIADWAELPDYLDVPIRAFSSGMLARLAFAVAVDVKPDVLLVDEILSVGDEAFQRKSSERMTELIEGGAAVILVTHNMQQVLDKANRVLWLDHGRAVQIGDPAGTVSAYIKSTGGAVADASTSSAGNE